MKKFLLIVFSVLYLFGNKANAQSLTFEYDTAYFLGSNEPHIVNDYVLPSTNMALNWKVIATNFPADWLPHLGLCDNVTCYNNSDYNGMGAGSVWNGTTGTTYTSNTYTGNAHGFYDMQLDLTNTSTGDTSIYYVTVQFTDAANTQVTRNMTFMVSKTLGVNNIPKIESNISLYPNPASNNINVVYGAEAGVKNIAVYNLIGKVMTYYKPSGNASANLDISNIPSGIYFIRLFDENGGVIATRKFTRQ